MKFVLCFLLSFILFLSPVVGQSSYGVSAGIDFSKVSFYGFRFSDRYIADVGFSYPSLEMGLQSKHTLSKKFSLSLSMHHTNKKDILRAKKEVVKLEAIKVQFELLKNHGTVHYELFKNLRIGLGLSHRYIFNAKTIYLNGDELRSSYNRTNMALLAGISYSYNRFHLSLNFARGEALNFDFISEFYDLTERINNIEWRISYFFWDRGRSGT